ncbi:MAG: hypothetical protein ABI920_15770 [Casimicrobiaceae bacterium]
MGPIDASVAPRLVRIDAIVAPTEEAGLAAAGRRLEEALVMATGAPWRIEMRLLDALPRAECGAAMVASLLSEVAGRSTLEEVEARWRELLSVARRTYPATLLCTVFRHVPRGSTNETEIVERIRRLDLLAAELSYATGCAVVDVDRDLAHIGAARMQCDFQLRGGIAERVMGHVIAAAILSVGLDDVVEAKLRALALRRLGKLSLDGTLHPVAGSSSGTIRP